MVIMVSLYCAYWSSAGLTRYTFFQDPNTLEAWESQQARVHGKVALDGQTIQAAIRATGSHSVFLSRNMDKDSNWEADVINFLNPKTMRGQTAQGLYESMLWEELTR